MSYCKSEASIFVIIKRSSFSVGATQRIVNFGLTYWKGCDCSWTQLVLLELHPLNTIVTVICKPCSLINDFLQWSKFTVGSISGGYAKYSVLMFYCVLNNNTLKLFLIEHIWVLVNGYFFLSAKGQIRYIWL